MTQAVEKEIRRFSETCNYNSVYKQTQDHIHQERVYWEQLYTTLNEHLAQHVGVVI